MPLATDFASFGAVGVPLLNSPNTGNSQQWPGMTMWNVGPFQKPVSSNFVIHQSSGTSTVSDLTDRLQIAVPAQATMYMDQPLVGAPYTVDMLYAGTGLPVTGNDCWMGMAEWDGSAGPLGVSLGCSWSYSSATTQAVIEVQHRTSPTVNSANVLATAMSTLCANYIWLRLVDDGTNRTCYHSPNGKDFNSIFNEASSTFVTPTRVGPYFFNPSNNRPMKIAVYHFKVTPGLLGDAP